MYPVSSFSSIAVLCSSFTFYLLKKEFHLKVKLLDLLPKRVHGENSLSFVANRFLPFVNLSLEPAKLTQASGAGSVRQPASRRNVEKLRFSAAATHKLQPATGCSPPSKKKLAFQSLVFPLRLVRPLGEREERCFAARGFASIGVL